MKLNNAIIDNKSRIFVILIIILLIPMTTYAMTGSAISEAVDDYNKVNDLSPSHPNTRAISKNSTHNDLLTNFSTFLGSTPFEVGSKVSIDSQDNIIIAGGTDATNLPGQLSALEAGNRDQADSFLAKFNSSGHLIWSRFLGGRYGEGIHDMTIDDNDNIIVVGVTTSNDFPIINGYDSQFQANGVSDYISTDGFIANISSGGILTQSTFLGGNSSDKVNSVAIDSLGRIVVAGHTFSDDFPRVGGERGFYGGDAAFIARFDGLDVLDLSFSLDNIGEYNAVTGVGVGLTSSGDIVVAGNSRDWDSEARRSIFELYVAKYTDTGTRVFAHNYGGSDNEYMEDMVIDSDDNIFFTGITLSSDVNLVGAHDSSFGGVSDGLLAKYTSSGILSWSTYVGGNQDDRTYGLTLDSADTIYVTGIYNLTDWNGFRQENLGSYGFLSRYSSSGIRLWMEEFDGNGIEKGLALATDSVNNIYLTGFTDSTDFPLLHATDETIDGTDAILMKYTYHGVIQSSTLFSGWADDQSYEINTDSQDNAIFTGHTTTQNYPLKSSRYYYFDGLPDQDLLVTKLANNGSILWSTLWGGSRGDDISYGTAIDSNDDIIVVGYTYSPNFRTQDAFEDTISGSADAFVTKFSSTGSVEWSTYLGGSGGDIAYDVTVDLNDEIIVTGTTTSSNFPSYNTTGGSYQGGSDTFLAKFSSSGNLIWSRYAMNNGGNDRSYSVETNSTGHIFIAGSYDIKMGGKTPEYDAYIATVDPFGKNDGKLVTAGGLNDSVAYSIKIDDEDNVFLTGVTKSSDFLPMYNGYDTTYNGNGDVFLIYYSPSMDLKWSTFIGGSEFDFIFPYAMDIDSIGNVVLAIDTASNNIDTLHAYDPTVNGGQDTYLIKLSRLGELIWSTYLGGSVDDLTTGIAISSTDDVFIVGTTESTDYPVYNAYDDTYNGGIDIFVTRMYDPFGDIDEDGLPNIDEIETYNTNPQNPDTDGDGIPDGVEINWGSNPTLQDGKADTDSDGMPNYWEYINNLNGSDPTDATTDLDQDGLTNLDEYNLGTDPNLADTDGDGLTDKEEVDNGTDPLDNQDPGMSNNTLTNTDQSPTSPPDQQDTNKFKLQIGFLPILLVIFIFPLLFRYKEI